MNISSRIKTSHIIVITLIVIGSLLRFYNLKNSLQFLGDQGRDALIVSKIFTEGDLVFIGPVTSVGNMYLGPLYYYFMVPFLWLSYPSPMGPVYAVAALGCVTLGLFYMLGKELVGEKSAIIGLFFYTFSHIVVQYTRFSWNPNPSPLVSLILIWATYKAWTNNARYWVIAAVCFSILAQLHYVSLLTGAGASIFWLLSVIDEYQSKNGKQLKGILRYSVVSGLIFITSQLPLLLFDWKHNWLNVHAFQKLFTQEQAFKTTHVFSIPELIWKTVTELHGRSMQILFEFPIGQQRIINTLLVIAVFIILGVVIRKKHQEKKKSGELLLGVFLSITIIGTAFYNQSVFIHYISFIFPVTFLVYGRVFTFLFEKNKATIPIIVFFSVYFLFYNLPKMPFQSLGWTVSDIEKTAHTIAERVDNDQLYNIILLADSGDLHGMNYRYFLFTTGKKPASMEQFGDAQKLFIINENQQGNDVLNLPIWEIQTFPQKIPSEVYTIENGPQIIVLERE